LRARSEGVEWDGQSKKRRHGSTVKGSSISSLVAAERNFRQIMVFRDLWMLEAALREEMDKVEKAA
jgi:hypothetical protein